VKKMRLEKYALNKKPDDLQLIANLIRFFLL